MHNLYCPTGRNIDWSKRFEIPARYSAKAWAAATGTTQARPAEIISSANSRAKYYLRGLASRR